MSKREDIPISGPYHPRSVGLEGWTLCVDTDLKNSTTRVVELDPGFMLDLAIDLHKEIIKSGKEYSRYKEYREMCQEMP